MPIPIFSYEGDRLETDTDIPISTNADIENWDCLILHVSWPENVRNRMKKIYSTGYVKNKRKEKLEGSPRS